MPRVAKNKASTRLNLQLSEAVRDRLEELRDEVDADSITEVVRRALALYDHVWRRSQEGDKVVLRGKKGDEALTFF